MEINKEDIIQICNQFLPQFINNIKDIDYEIGGIFNSEMLLVIAIAKYLNVKQIVESGRANGQSTKILGENFKNSDIEIISIEYERYSANVRVANERLKGYRNINLIYGDSFKLIPKLLKDESIVLIDGPKRTAAIELAIQSFNNPLVKAVFIHDLYKDSPHRKPVETIFLNTFFTDDAEYVNHFKKIDLKCWLAQRKHKYSRTWSPYRRGNRKFKSYSSTLLVIFNTKRIYNNTYFKKHLKQVSEWKSSWKIRYFLEGWPKRLKYFILFPKYYIYYDKSVKRNSSINIIDLFSKWAVRIMRSLRSLFKRRVSYYLEDD